MVGAAPGSQHRCTSTEGTVVLDVDPRNGGDAALAELVSRHDRLPETWTCCTGSGASYLVARFGAVQGRLCDGVDLKSNAGYLVVPPSIHPNGQPYRWANALPVAHAPRVAATDADTTTGTHSINTVITGWP